jgi:hypothetical protein
MSHRAIPGRRLDFVVLGKRGAPKGSRNAAREKEIKSRNTRIKSLGESQTADYTLLLHPPELDPNTRQNQREDP